ncbi:MAG: putative peptidoglycan-binding domain-containing protein [Candidatus Aminicenantales bacterium]
MTTQTPKISIQFTESMNRLQDLEGEYAPPILYPEGETWLGIVRKWHPDFEGWEIIDQQKLTDPDFPKNLRLNTQLMIQTDLFYLEKYWEPAHIQKLANVAANIDFEVFEMTVHMGKTTAIKLFQRTLNQLNKNQKLYKNINEDGIIGPQTLYALNQAIPTVSIKTILFLLQINQGCYYLKLWENDEEKEKYHGWLRRLSLKTNHF